MESWCLRKHKSSLLILMMLLASIVEQLQGVCIEDERKALLEIKASLINELPYRFDVHDLLFTWVDLETTRGGECCDWERIKCDTTTGHIIGLFLSNMLLTECATNDVYPDTRWPLKFYPILRFKELKSLDLSCNFIDDTIVRTGLERLSSLNKLEMLNLSNNKIETNIFPLLAPLTSLKTLDLSYSNGYQFSPTYDISDFSVSENMEVLDLSYCGYYGTLQIQEVANMPNLEVLLLSNNAFNGTLPMEALVSFHRLKVLDLSWNSFVGSIPSTIKSLSSLKAITFANNNLNGSLPNGLCELKNLYELDLSGNMFDGNLPKCFNRLSYLKLFDISSNQLTGMLPPSLIANLKSLEYINFGLNKFEGSFSFSSLSNHTKLEFFLLERDNDKLEVEIEEPTGWIPMFQLKVLVLPNRIIKRLKGSVVPGFLLHQHKLQVLDLSHNSMEGPFPNWLLKNNSKLKILSLRNNSLQGVMLMAYLSVNTRFLDMSSNLITGIIPHDIQKLTPYIEYLNVSNNDLNGVIPSLVCDLHHLRTLDLSQNNFSGEVPKGLFKNLSNLQIIKLSKNSLHGQILSGNLSLGGFSVIHLDNNYFTGNIGNNVAEHTTWPGLLALDIGDNLFKGTIPSWISNASSMFELVARNNIFEGWFPCGKAPLRFLDISQNLLSGPIPYCLNWEHIQHLHLGSNKFTGLVPSAFRNLTNLLTLDIGNNHLSGRIPEFLGDLSNLRIILLGKNNFSGSIPKKLCKLSNVSFIDLSSNSLSGLIPRCLHFSIGPKELVFIQNELLRIESPSFYVYETVILYNSYYRMDVAQVETQDEAQFTTKRNSLTYKGKVLDYMLGLDLSCNKLMGEIPPELGILTHILNLNLSHNKLTGPIPVNLSNLIEIESLDLSFNGLTGKVPSELIQLHYLEVFNVSYNNLSGKLPEGKGQFATFTKESYEGNPLLCGLPLENKCITETQVTHPSDEEGINEKWYDMDMASFYGSSGVTWFVFMLGFATLLYINPNWRRMWLKLVEECIYTCYFFLYDLVRKPSMIFHN